MTLGHAARGGLGAAPRALRARTLRARTLNLATALFSLALLGAAALLTPSAEALRLPDGRVIGLLCLFRELSGLPCPFCGLSRSMSALVHLDLSMALGAHPAGPVMLVLFLVSSVWALGRGLLGRPALLDHPPFRRLLEGAALIGVVAGIARFVAGSP